MAAFSITDSADNPVDFAQVDWSKASSIPNYAKSELLHLIVAPDFISRKDKTLTAAAPEPLRFDLSIHPGFALGAASSELTITPGAKAELRIDCASGSSLFDDDEFHAPSVIPANTAYVGLALTGSLDAAGAVSMGELSFGIDQATEITFCYLKAFATHRNQPTLGAATHDTLASFVIPANVADFARLNLNDVCCVSGTGNLQVTAAASVSLFPNPLASVSLPLGAGTLSVQSGVVSELGAMFMLTGSYQVRVEKTSADVIRLSWLRQRGATLEVDAVTSAGIAVDRNATDLLAKVLGKLERGGVDPKIFSALTPDEINDFNGALKSSLDHSVAASVKLALSTEKDDEALFQYELTPAQFDGDSAKAVTRALRGDLRILSALEPAAGSDGTIMAGVKLLNSATSTARKRGAAITVNLLGIVNLITMSQLLDKCEFLYEPANGDLTIKRRHRAKRSAPLQIRRASRQRCRKRCSTRCWPQPHM